MNDLMEVGMGLGVRTAIRKWLRGLEVGASSGCAAEISEQGRLAALPAARCDVSALGSFSTEWLAESFADPRIDSDWAEDVPRLEALGIPELTGGVNPGDRRALYYLVRRLRPREILEIGTHIGSSTTAIALAAARNRTEGIPTRITSADIRDVNDETTQPWKQARSPASPASLLEVLGCHADVRFETNPSFEALARRDRRFGMVFLDGNHDADFVYREIPLALSQLEEPGLIVLHDYFPGQRPLWPDSPPIVGPFLGVDRFQREDAPFRAVPLGDLPWPTKFGTRTTSLAVLSR